MAPIIFRALVYKRYRIFNRAPDLRQTWNNGKEVPRWGVAEIQKMSPSTTLGDVIVVTNSPPIGHMRSQLTNHKVGIVLDVQSWWKNYIRRPDVVERIGSYLGTSFPLFHACWPLHDPGGAWRAVTGDGGNK